jgi:uncharacterized membrane protein
MLYSLVLFALSGIALFVNNRRVKAPFSTVELLLIFVVLAHEINYIALSCLGALNIDPWYLANRPAALSLSLIYGTAASSEHLAIILAARAFARRSAACAQLSFLTSIFIGVVVTVGVFIEIMMARYTTMTPYPTWCIYHTMKASFIVHNYALPAVSVALIIALLVVRRKEDVVKRHCDILISCASLLVVSRLYILRVLPSFEFAHLTFKTMPEVFVIFIAAYNARDFSAMVSGQSDVGLPVSYEDSKPPVDSSEPFEVVTAVDEKTGASRIDHQ